MDENTNTTNDNANANTAKVDESTTDWKAEARKWEKRAKENSGAADELAKLKESQMTELEKANAEAEKAKAEADALKAEKAKSDAAIKASAETGVPVDLLMFCADADTVESFAKALGEYVGKTQGVRVGSSVGKSRIIHPDTTKASSGDIFAALFTE